MTNEPELKPLTTLLDEGVPCQSQTELDAARADMATHLANERTFLAWNFTALFIIGGGVGLARTLIALNTSPLTAAMESSHPTYLKPTTIGLVFMVAGLIVEVVASCRYLTVHRQIIEHRHQPSSMPVMMFLAIVLVLCIVLAGYLLELRGTI